MAKTWKKFYDGDAKETWYESSDGKGRILQETAGDNRGWNIQFKDKNNNWEYVRNDNNVAFYYESARSAKNNFETDVNDFNSSSTSRTTTRGIGSTSTSRT